MDMPQLWLGYTGIGFLHQHVHFMDGMFWCAEEGPVRGEGWSLEVAPPKELDMQNCLCPLTVMTAECEQVPRDL